jgi:hypothetical protein
MVKKIATIVKTENTRSTIADHQETNEQLPDTDALNSSLFNDPEKKKAFDIISQKIATSQQTGGDNNDTIIATVEDPDILESKDL